MPDLSHKSIYHVVLTRALLWGTLAVGVTANPLLAQNTVGGNFTLNENTRFGSTVLGPGQYKFSIEPVGNLQSVHSIQGASHLVQVVVRPEKSGPVASLFAMASPSGNTREASELILASEKAETLATTMCLEKDGLVLKFLRESEGRRPSCDSEGGTSTNCRGTC